MKNFKLYFNVEKTPVFQRWKKKTFCRLWTSCDEVFFKTVFLKLSEIFRNLLRFLSKLEPTGGANILIWKNVLEETFREAVRNYRVIIPEGEQSKKIQCVQNWKYVIFTHRRKGHLQICSLFPTTKHKNSAARVKYESLGFAVR